MKSETTYQSIVLLGPNGLGSQKGQNKKWPAQVKRTTNLTIGLKEESFDKQDILDREN